MSTINSKEINDKIASLPSRDQLSKEQQRQEDIAAINDYALRNPDKVFNDDFREQRKHLTEETWKAIIQANPDMQDSASDKWRKIPDANIVNKYQGQAFSGEVRKAINEDGVKLAGLAAAVPGAIIGADLLASAAPTAINFLTKVGEKAYPFTQKLIEPVFNKMNPFSKEFAQMGLAEKSAVGGLESLGALHAINTTTDFIKDPKVYKIPDVVMADMIGLPYGLAAGQRLYGAYNKATAPFRIARLMNQNIKNTNLGPTVFDDAVLQGKVGWAPSQTIDYRHGSDNANLERFIPYATWDVEKHGASPFKFFGTEISSPRNMMDERPFQYFGSTKLNKPIVQIGEFNPQGVKNNTRNLLVNESRRRGADSYYLQNIADNKAENQNVLIKFIGQEGEPIATKSTSSINNETPELLNVGPLIKKHYTTINLRQYLNRNLIDIPDRMPHFQHQIEQMKSFLDPKVNIEQFSDKDIQNLLKLRLLELNKQASGRFAMQSSPGKYQLYTKGNNTPALIGDVSFSNKSDGTVGIGMVNNYTYGPNAEKGVSEDLYNLIIHQAKQNGMKGLKSGHDLRSPLATTKIWERYPNKIILSETEGAHTIDNVVTPGPVVLLTEPSKPLVSLKSYLFDPSIIKGSKMIIDWNKGLYYKNGGTINYLNLFKNNFQK